MDPARLSNGDVRLTPRSEKEFQRKVERVGGYAVDRDGQRCLAPCLTLGNDVELILEALNA